MQNINLNFLLAKYAIALSIGYLFGFVWVFISHNFITVGKSYTGTEFELLQNLPTYISFGINIIIAFMTAYDMKKLGSINWFVVIISALFGFLGVGLFFIYAFYLNLTKKSA